MVEDEEGDYETSDESDEEKIRGKTKQNKARSNW